METSAGASGKDGAQRGTGTACRRRAQRARQTAKHVQWLVGLCQAQGSHHTAGTSRQSHSGTGDDSSPLEKEVRAQRLAIDKIFFQLGDLQLSLEHLEARTFSQDKGKGKSKDDLAGNTTDKGKGKGNDKGSGSHKEVDSLRTEADAKAEGSNMDENFGDSHEAVAKAEGSDKVAK